MISSLEPPRAAAFFHPHLPNPRIPTPPSFIATCPPEPHRLHLSLAKNRGRRIFVSSYQAALPPPPDDDSPFDLDAELDAEPDKDAAGPVLDAEMDAFTACFVDAILSPADDIGIPQEDSEIAPELDSERAMERDEGEGAGIEGILKGLDKERGWSARRTSQRDLEGVGDTDDMKNQAANMWKTKSLWRPGFLETGSDGKEQRDQNFIDDVIVDNNMHKVAQSTKDTSDKDTVPYSDAKEVGKGQISLRLQHLEPEVEYLLSLLSTRSDVSPDKGKKNSLKESTGLSDNLEFQETEIANAREKLRLTQAELAVLKEKMVHEIVEAQKLVEDQQRRFDASQKASHDLRTTCVMLPHHASEVLLVGSFDGWTGQRRMERSSTGIFSLNLKLYPGRYEIKFLADGVWTLDPLRSIVRNKGHKNNLLIVK